MIRGYLAGQHSLSLSCKHGYLNDGSAVPSSANLNFMIPFIAEVDASSTSLDLKAQQTFELKGTHDLTQFVF